MSYLRDCGCSVSSWLARVAGCLRSRRAAWAESWRKHLMRELRQRTGLPPMLESLEVRRVFSFIPPSVQSLNLFNDTGTPGDYITNVPVVEGSVYLSEGSRRSLPVQFDLNGDGAPEGMTYTDNDETGHFTANLAGTVFAPGQVQPRFRAGAPNPEAGNQVSFGDWSYTFYFTYEPETPTSGGDPSTHLPDVSASVFLGGAYEPSVGGSSGYEPTEYQGGGARGGEFAAFSNWTYATGGSSYTINDIDSDPTPFIETWSDGSGSYIRSTSDTRAYLVTSVHNPDNSWSYVESLVLWRVVQTTFTGSGRSWVMTQGDSHTYSFQASGQGASHGQYSLLEDRGQSLDFDLTIGAVPIYSELSGQSYTLVASGSNVNYTRTETQVYTASGVKNFTSVFAGGSSEEDWVSSVELDSDWDASIFTAVSWPSGGQDSRVRQFTVNHNDLLLEQNDRSTDVTTVEGGGGRSLTTHATADDSNDTTTVRHMVVTGQGTLLWGAGFTGYTSVGVGTYIDDIYNHSGHTTVALSDTATPGITVSGNTAVDSTAHRERSYEQHTLGVTPFTSGWRGLFSTTVNGTNETTSNWHTEQQSIASGTDQSVQGVTRHFQSDHSGEQNGQSHYLMTSSGSKQVDVFNQAVYAGRSDAIQDESGDYTWVNIDSSDVDSSTSVNAGGLVTERTEIGQSSSTDQGSGSFTAHAEGHAVSTSGSVSRTGSSNHNGHTDGTLFADHHYQTTQTITDARVFGRLSVTDSSAESVSHSDGEYHAVSIGNGSYDNGSTSLHERLDRDEIATTTTTSHEQTTVEVEDDSVNGVHDESSVTTVLDHTSEAQVVSDGSSINDQVNGASSWSEIVVKTTTGGGQTETTTQGTQSHEDTSAWNVTTTSSGVSDSWTLEDGSFTVEETLASQGSSGGSASSTIDRIREDTGKYQITTSSSSHTETDDDSGPLSRDQNTDAADGFDGSGTFRRVNESHEATSPTGQYTATITNENHTEDSGTTSYQVESEVFVDGVQNNGSTVTETHFHGWNFEERHGTQDRTTDRVSESVTQFGQVTTSVEESTESHETGSSNWNGLSDSSSVQTTDNYGGEERRVEDSDTHSVSWGSGTYRSDSATSFTDDGNGYWERSSDSQDSASGSNGYDSTTDAVTTLADTHEPGVSRSTTTTIHNHEHGGGTYHTSEDREDSSNTWGQNNHEVWTSANTTSSGNTDASFRLDARENTSTNQTSGYHSYINGSGQWVSVPIVEVTTRQATNSLVRTSTGTFQATSDLSSGTINSQTQSSSRDWRRDSGGYNEQGSEVTIASIRQNGGGVYSKVSDQTSRSTSAGSGTYQSESLNFHATYFDGTSESAVEAMATATGSSLMNHTTNASSQVNITYNQRDSHKYSSKGTTYESRRTGSTVTDTSSDGSYTWRDYSSANFERRVTDERGTINDTYRYDASSAEDKVTRTNYGEYTVVETRKESSKISASNSGSVAYTIHDDQGHELVRNGTYTSWIDTASVSDSTYNNFDSASFSTTVTQTGNPSFTQNQSSKTDKTYRLAGGGYVEHYVQGENGQNTTTHREGSDHRETVTEKSESTNATVDTTRYTTWPIGERVKRSDSTTTLDITAITDHEDWIETVTGPQYFQERFLEETETFTGKDSVKQNVSITENRTHQDGTTNAFSYTGSQTESNKDNYTAYQQEHEVSDQNGHSLVERDRMNATSTQTWDNRNNSSTDGVKGSIRVYTRNTQTDAGNAQNQYSHNYTIDNGVINGTRTRTLGGSGNFVDSQTKGTEVTDTASLSNGTRTTIGNKSHTDTTNGNYNGTSTFRLTVTNGDRYEVSDTQHHRSETESQRDDESFEVREHTGDSAQGHTWTRDRNETRSRAIITSDRTDTTTTRHAETGQQEENDLHVVQTHTEGREFGSRNENSSSDDYSSEGSSGSSSSHTVDEYTVNRSTEDRTEDGQTTHAVTRSQADSTDQTYSGRTDYDGGFFDEYNSTYGWNHTRDDRREGDGSGTWSEHTDWSSESSSSDNYFDGHWEGHDTASSDRAATVDTYGWGTYTTYSDQSEYDYRHDWLGDYWEHWWGNDSSSISGGTRQWSYSHSYANNYDSWTDADSGSDPFNTSAPGHMLSGWEDTWNLFSDLMDDLSYEAFVAFNSALQAWYNPLGFITGVWDGILDYVETQVDGTIGFIDGFLNAINPFDSWWSIPDIGPVFGHNDAYFVGQIVGTVGALVASIMIGNVAGGASGLIACGSLAQKAAQIYTAVDTVAGIAQATQHLIEGNAGISDALAFLPVATMGLQKLRGIEVNCFEGGTRVLVVGKDGGVESRNIEDVLPGDSVWTRDENDPDAPMTPSTVTEVYRKTVFSLQSVTVSSVDGASTEVLSVTPEHAFYVAGKGWVAARDLTPGAQIVGADGRSMLVKANSVDERPVGVVVYNLNVDGGHTYAVADAQGESAFIWTHNACRLSAEDQFAQALNPAQYKNARAMLRRQLGGIPDHDAHHLIPLEAVRRHEDVMRRAARGGFGINSAENGLMLRRYLHGHGHPEYIDYICRKLARISDDLSDADTAAAVRDIAAKAEQVIKRYNRPLP